MLRHIFIIIFILFAFVSVFHLEDVSSAEDYGWLQSAGWRIIDSDHCTVMLHPDVNLEKVNKKVNVRFHSLDNGAFSPKYKSIESQIGEKVDRIFKKVERVLDMYPNKIHLNIKIFRTQAQLDEEYGKIFGHNDGVLRISYYIHKYTTIFTTELAIREGILAHEMGHAIADHYFLVSPSERIKELLAQYAEIHLEE